MVYLFVTPFGMIICLYYAFNILAILYTTRDLAKDIYFNISEGIKTKAFYLLKIMILIFLFLLPGLLQLFH